MEKDDHDSSSRLSFILHFASTKVGSKENKSSHQKFARSKSKKSAPKSGFHQNCIIALKTPLAFSWKRETCYCMSISRDALKLQILKGEE